MKGQMTPGTKLGRYEIRSKLGAGGMGEVYLARDPRLDRDVAIKVLPDGFADDPERLARFEREAKLLASLNHPNIAAVYGFEEADALRCIVLELVPGQTLAERLAAGPLPVEEALGLARQIAEALEAAHGRGVMHRDLKPANIKVTDEEQVKVLDFGLAKALEVEAPAADLSASPTLLYQGTRQGLILGTPRYMSPEQAKGKRADKRTDVWSFGCVLYEMLAGHPAFGGETVSDILAEVLRGEPDWEALPAATPPRVRDLLRRCLQKDPRRRLHDIADARIEIEEALSEPAEVTQATDAPAAARRMSWRRDVPLVLAGLAAGALLTGLLFWASSRRAASGPLTPQAVRRVAVTLPDGEPLALAKFGPMGIGRTSVALSPDGSLLAYAGERNGRSQLYMRPLDQADAKPIAGTEGAYNPFFSPDGRQVGFFAENKMKKVSLAGGEPVTLCEARIPHGASWGPDDTIVFADSEGINLSRVSAAGGQAQALLKLEYRVGYPEFLPGGKAVLFSHWASNNPDHYEIALLSLETGRQRILLKGGTNPRYAASGHVVFARAGALLAAPFDPSRLEVTGPEVTLVEGVRIEEWGAAQFALSSEGTLVYAGGGPARIGRLTWVDQNGASKPLAAPAQAYGEVRVSPDGRRLAVSVVGATNDIWVYEFARGTFTRLTVEGINSNPRWAPDGRGIVYRRNGPDQFELVRKLADGSGAEEVLIASKDPMTPYSWSPDGKVLAFSESSRDTGGDLWMLPLEGDRRPSPWLRTKFNEWGPAFSPDGRWIAYTSDESGQYEVYIRSYPGPGGKWQVSTAGGEEAVWSRDGRRLFYREGPKWMSVAVRAGAEFSAEAPKLMFEGPYLNVAGISYDVAPDGQRFIMIEENQRQGPTTELNVVLNWTEELRRRVPAGR